MISISYFYRMAIEYYNGIKTIYRMSVEAGAILYQSSHGLYENGSDRVIYITYLFYYLFQCK